MFNQHHTSKQIFDTLHYLGVKPFSLPDDLMPTNETEVNIITFFLTIDNHLKLKKIMAQIDDLIAKVKEQKTLEDSLVLLLKDIKAQLNTAIANGADPVKLQELADAIDANTKELTDAVTANTPAAQVVDPNTVIPATTSGTAAGSTGSDSGAGSTDGSTPPADGSAPQTATDAVNG